MTQPISPLSLRDAPIRMWWQRRDPGMDRLLQQMDGVETWPVDGHLEVAEALYKLTLKINQDAINLDAHLDDILDLLAYLSSSRALRVVAFVDEQHNNAMRFLQRAGERVASSVSRQNGVDAGGQMMVDRLRVLERAALLGRLFAPERLSAVREMLRDAYQA